MIEREAVMAALDSPEIPPIVAAWCVQLLSPEVLRMVNASPAEQIDIRLSAAKGRVRKNPVVIFNAGPAEMVDP